MGSVSIAVFAFMLIVITATAYPMRKQKMMSEDLIKAINYLWNEEMGKEQHAGLQNEDTEKDKIEKGNETKEGDGEVKAPMDLWKTEKDEDKDHFKTMIDTGC